MAQIIDGKTVSLKLRHELKEKVQAFHKKYGVAPGLATILVGHDPASQVYIKGKIKATEACGMKSFHFDYPDSLSEEELLKKIEELNQNQNVHGILVQLPLPKHISPKKVLKAIAPEKDVDGFHPLNIGYLTTSKTHLPPCTPAGVMALLEHYKIDLKGKHAVVVGRSNIVGRPMSLMLLRAHATVTMTHRYTENLSQYTKMADVIVVAVGKPNLITADMVKDGVVVVDVGMNRLSNGKLCGDVDFEKVKEKASYITPVPGGVGPMTITMLMINTYEAAREILSHN